jgi:hypothetical protein
MIASSSSPQLLFPLLAITWLYVMAATDKLRQR